MEQVAVDGLPVGFFLVGTDVFHRRIILLHGPPGTGKTSLCRALAHKLAIRLSHRYRYGQLIEVNSHSLFSKWFSESGKLVQRMFEAIQVSLVSIELFPPN